MEKQKKIPALRFPEFEGKWESERLGNISVFISKGTTPTQFSQTGVNYVKIESLNGKNIVKDRCLFIDEKIHIGILRRSILKENDILFAIAGATIGKIGIVTKDILPANTNQALAIIRLKNKLQISFILFVLSSIAMKRYIEQSISVGAQPNLNLQQINDFRFYNPHPPRTTKNSRFSQRSRFQNRSTQKEA